MGLMRDLVRGVVPGVYDAQELLTGLRAGTFCEWVGSSDVSEISSKTLCINILVLSLGKPPFGRRHS